MKAIPNPLWAFIAAFYHKLFERALRWPRLTLALIPAADGRCTLTGPDARGRVSAQARRRKYLGARDDAADYLTRARRDAHQRDAAMFS